MKIAPQHQPGGWKADGYQPACAWPDECYVQWGANGVVARRSGGGYRTAFFEAFPSDNAGGFIRGEGADIQAAEAAAFAKYTRQIGCEHRWQRRDYVNGGGFCAKCNAFQTAFKPITKLGEWRRPLSQSEVWMIRHEDFSEPAETEGWAKLRRRLAIRLMNFGVEQ